MMYMMSTMTVMMMSPVVAVESTLTSVQIQQDVASVCLCSMPSASLGIDVSPSPYRSFFPTPMWFFAALLRLLV